MTIAGVDYAGDRPDPAGLVAAGKRFVIRYGGPGGSWKHLDAAEAAALTGAGLLLVANAEGTADGLLGGWDVGVSWAREADSHFRGLGMPAGRPIYLSVDFDCDGDKQWAAVAQALRGAASVLGALRVGVYGSFDVMVWARRDRVAAWFWQTYAWSGGRWAAGNHIEQYRNGIALAGGTVDLCRALAVDYGQWTIGGADMSLDPATKAAYDQVYGAMVALRDGTKTVAAGGVASKDHWLVDQVERIRADVAALAARPAPMWTDEQVDAVAAKLVAATDNPLGEADEPAIAAGLKRAIAELAALAFAQPAE